MVVRMFFVLLAFCGESCAKDFGVQGKISPIGEIDPVVLIKGKLKEMEKRGELLLRQEEMKKKAKAILESPHPVEGLSKAKKTRVWRHDPTFVLERDIRDHEERLIVKKGERVNPLDQVSMREEILFLDGEDEEELNWLRRVLEEGEGKKVILVRGGVLKVGEEMQRDVYFDQGGFLIKKLKIKHHPARVRQEGKALRIEEVCLGEKR